MIPTPINRAETQNINKTNKFINLNILQNKIKRGNKNLS